MSTWVCVLQLILVTALPTELQLCFVSPTSEHQYKWTSVPTEDIKSQIIRHKHTCAGSRTRVFLSCCYNTNRRLCSLHWRKLSLKLHLTLKVPVVLYVPRSGQYMYRTVVNIYIYKAQWSLYVPHSGHYMYRSLVNICTSQWSLYVPHRGQYMYRTVVNMCTSQWSL